MGKHLTLWSFSLHCLCASQVPFDAVQWMNRLGKPPRACYSGNTYPGLNFKTRPVLKGLKNNGGGGFKLWLSKVGYEETIFELHEFFLSSKKRASQGLTVCPLGFFLAISREHWKQDFVHTCEESNPEKLVGVASLSISSSLSQMVIFLDKVYILRESHKNSSIFLIKAHYSKPPTRLLKCFVLVTLCCKSKYLRSLIRGILQSFEWVEILGLSNRVHNNLRYSVCSERI